MNCCFIVVPVFFILALYGLQKLVDDAIDDRDNRVRLLKTESGENDAL